MAHDVFISHSAKDKPIADAACAALEAKGIRCWIAPRDIMAGQSWPKAIMSGIMQARAMVVIFSAHSNHAEAVLNEIERAYHNNLIIVPFRVDEEPMAEDMEFFLSRRHWLDAVTPPLEAHLALLAEQLLQVLPATPPKPEEAPPPVVPMDGTDATPRVDFDMGGGADGCSQTGRGAGGNERSSHTRQSRRPSRNPPAKTRQHRSERRSAG